MVVHAQRGQEELILEPQAMTNSATVTAPARTLAMAKTNTKVDLVPPNELSRRRLRFALLRLAQWPAHARQSLRLASH